MSPHEYPVGPDHSVVAWHPDAEGEVEAISDFRERRALDTAIIRLRTLGARLPFPHQSAVRASRTRGLRELRPRASRSTVRALYVPLAHDRFIVLAIAPEAARDHRGFRRAIARADERAETMKEIGEHGV